MTTDEAKKELENIRYLKALIKSTRNEIDELEGVAYSPKSPNYKSLGFNPSVNNESPTERNAISIVTLQEEHEKIIKDYAEAFVTIIKKLNMLDVKDKTILQLHYIDNLSYRDIGRQLYYSHQQIKFNLESALKNYAEL